MIKKLAARLELLWISLALLLTMMMMMGIIGRFNKRWDFTKEKLYSLSDQTYQMLARLDDAAIEVTGFYPQDDQVRSNFETFLKACRLSHPRFKYAFYDPDRVPS